MSKLFKIAALSLLISLNMFASQVQNEAVLDEVRFEIQTLNMLYRFVHHLDYPARAWPAFWPEAAYHLKQAAWETVGDVDNSDFLRGLGSSYGEYWQLEAEETCWQYIEANPLENPKKGALMLWWLTLAYEEKIKNTSKEEFASFYDDFSDKNLDKNRSLDLAINHLLRIEFKPSDSVLIEIQLFLALKILRCVLLMYPNSHAFALENFITKYLPEVPEAQAIYQQLNSTIPLHQLVKDRFLLNQMVEKLFYQP